MNYTEVAAALQPYIEAARTGNATASRQAWMDHARIVGSVDGAFAADTPDELVAWMNHSGPSPKIQSHIVAINVEGHAAAARVEFVDWAGFRFTDFFVLKKQNGVWRIAGKVYDAHRRNGAAGTAEHRESETESFKEYEGAAAVVEAYTATLRTGDAVKLKPLWFDHARIVGEIDGTPIDRDVDGFCQLVTKVGNQPNFKARIISLDRNGPAASARIELNNWDGVRYTDFLLLYKRDGVWRIGQKVFDAHNRR